MILQPTQSFTNWTARSGWIRSAGWKETRGLWSSGWAPACLINLIIDLPSGRSKIFSETEAAGILNLFLKISSELRWQRWTSRMNDCGVYLCRQQWRLVEVGHMSCQVSIG